MGMSDRIASLKAELKNTLKQLDKSFSYYEEFRKDFPQDGLNHKKYDLEQDRWHKQGSGKRFPPDLQFVSPHKKVYLQYPSVQDCMIYIEKHILQLNVYQKQDDSRRFRGCSCRIPRSPIR